MQEAADIFRTVYRRRPGNMPRQADFPRHADHGLAGAKASRKRHVVEGNFGRMASAVSKEAIAEAMEIAQRTFEDHAAEYAQEPLPA